MTNRGIVDFPETRLRLKEMMMSDDRQPSPIWLESPVLAELAWMRDLSSSGGFTPLCVSIWLREINQRVERDVGHCPTRTAGRKAPRPK